jgi:glycosyltransferase involved in cell wall biosynthesis
MPRPSPPQRVCVVAAIAGDANVDESLRSLRAHTPDTTRIVSAEPRTDAVNAAVAEHAPHDLVVVLESCTVGPEWLERLQAAARADTNTASASALSDTGTPLAVGGRTADQGRQLAQRVATQSLRLRPGLIRAVGPCVYLRRDAIELIGPLDESLPLGAALEVDFAARCLLSGLGHVAADDVAVERLATGAATLALNAGLTERYPFVRERTVAVAPAVLARALQAVRNTQERLSVTIDARVLGGALTGTHVHVVELIRALAQTERLRLRLLVGKNMTSDGLVLLRGLHETEVLSTEQLAPETPRSAIFHRPQQTFSADDVRLGCLLGERFVLSQLDLIAYGNPGYFPDADTWEAAQRATRQGLAAADRVVVFSEHTRRELTADSLASDERIRVVAPGLDHSAPAESRRPAALEESLAAPAAVGEPSGYLLCLGTDFRHKNRVFALQLLAALRDGHGWRGNLVFAGAHMAHGSSLELEHELMQQNQRLRDAVVDLGPVSEEEKAWLMRHTAAVVYPSTYEGFGLVPFESALTGVPCAFAPTSSLAELAPTKTPTLVPWDPAQSAAAVYPLLTDPFARERHVQALAAAAREFTWARTAAALCDVYADAALAPAREASAVSCDAAAREHELINAHDALVAKLVSEREHAKGMYDALNAEVGSGLSLIGPHGALPDEVQRALLALSARSALSKAVYRPLAGAFRTARAVARLARSRRRDR